MTYTNVLTELVSIRQAFHENMILYSVMIDSTDLASEASQPSHLQYVKTFVLHT